jgi:hypothetical protein
MPRRQASCIETRRKLRIFFSRVPDRDAATRLNKDAAQLAEAIRRHIQDVSKDNQLGCASCYKLYVQYEQFYWGDETRDQVLVNRKQEAN